MSKRTKVSSAAGSFGNRAVKGRWGNLDLTYTHPINDKWSASVTGTATHTRVKGKSINTSQNNAAITKLGVRRKGRNSELSFDYNPQSRSGNISYTKRFAEGGAVGDMYSDNCRLGNAEHVYKGHLYEDK